MVNKRNKAQGIRKTRSAAPFGSSSHVCPYNGEQTHGQLQLQYQEARSYKDFSRIPADELRRLSQLAPVRKAINTIVNGVLAVPWVILPPEEDASKASARQEATRIEQTLSNPNKDRTFARFVRAVLEDLLTFGCAVVERQAGDGSNQPFWLWDVDTSLVSFNPYWEPAVKAVEPRYYFGAPSKLASLIELDDRDVFVVQHEIRSYEPISPGPVEIAYHMILQWLNLNDYQSRAISNGSGRRIIQLADASLEEVEAFREYWRSEVSGELEIPITNRVVKVRSLKTQNDEALYLDYEAKVLKCTMMAFGLTNPDLETLDDSHKAKIDEMNDREVILPIAQTLYEHLQDEVIDFYYPGFRLKLVDSEPKSRTEEIRIAQLLYDKGVITQNEFRRRVDLEDLGPSGDYFCDGTQSGHAA